MLLLSGFLTHVEEGVRKTSDVSGFPGSVPDGRSDATRQRVMSLEDLRPGRFYFDYPNDALYLADDPSGYRVEIAATPFAFRGRPGINEVEIGNLVIEKFANASQKGVIFPDTGTTGPSWERGPAQPWYRYQRIRFLSGHRQSRPPQRAKGRGCDGTRHYHPEQRDLLHNTIGYSPGWEVVGSKFAFTSNLVVRGNLVHHNLGNGLWTDINNIHTLYENNVVRDNWGQGIFHEISYDAIIRNNTVRRNGFGRGRDWHYGAGIMVADSPNVEVYGNIVVNNFDGIIGIQQDRGSPWSFEVSTCITTSSR